MMNIDDEVIVWWEREDVVEGGRGGVSWIVEKW